MKKMLSMVLILMMALAMTAGAAAECGCGECAECVCRAGEAANGVLIAQSGTASGVYVGAAWWALAESQLVIGIKAPNEQAAILPMQAPEKTFIRGAVDNGLIREKSVMRVTFGTGGAVYGLTQIQVSVRIRAEFVGLVESIVYNRIGAGADITANSIIACSQWWDGMSVGHIFFTSATEKTAVGTVTVNGGADTIILWAGDFDGDGTLELGFCAGWTERQPEPAPERVPTPSDKKPCTPCNKKPCGKGGGCWNIQINIFSMVKNVFTKMCQ